SFPSRKRTRRSLYPSRTLPAPKEEESLLTQQHQVILSGKFLVRLVHRLHHRLRLLFHSRERLLDPGHAGDPTSFAHAALLAFRQPQGQDGSAIEPVGAGAGKRKLPRLPEESVHAPPSAGAAI